MQTKKHVSLTDATRASFKAIEEMAKARSIELGVKIGTGVVIHEMYKRNIKMTKELKELKKGINHD